MNVPKVKHVRASVVRGGGGDYHDVEDGHWIDDHAGHGGEQRQRHAPWRQRQPRVEVEDVESP